MQYFGSKASAVAGVAHWMTNCSGHTAGGTVVPLRKLPGVALYQPSIFKHRRKRSAAAIGERIGPALTIVRDESPYGHRLHGIYGDADGALINAGRDAEQNHPVLCAERRLQFLHRLLLSPSLGEPAASGYLLLAIGQGW
jgi:hypothetical protein